MVVCCSSSGDKEFDAEGSTGDDDGPANTYAGTMNTMPTALLPLV